MAIHELNDEQIRTWSLEQKDRWWLENVFRGDMPQLTLRSAVDRHGAGRRSVADEYLRRRQDRLDAGRRHHLGHPGVRAVQGLVAARAWPTSSPSWKTTPCSRSPRRAGYMTSPLISSLAAYMMVTGRVIPMWQTMSWIIVLAILGVLFAFPFKRRFINDEQQPFPEGRAAGIVMDSLHHGEAAAGHAQGEAAGRASRRLAAVVKLLQSETHHGISDRQGLHAAHSRVPGRMALQAASDGRPTILGTPVTNLTLRPELDLPMVGAGGLMGIRTGVSLMIGAIINYAVLAPIMIQRGDIVPNAARARSAFARSRSGRCGAAWR